MVVPSAMARVRINSPLFSDNSNLTIVAGGYSLATPAGTGNTGTLAIDAGTGTLLTSSKGRLVVKNGDYTLTHAGFGDMFFAKTTGAVIPTADATKVRSATNNNFLENNSLEVRGGNLTLDQVQSSDTGLITFKASGDVNLISSATSGGQSINFAGDLTIISGGAIRFNNVFGLTNASTLTLTAAGDITQSKVFASVNKLVATSTNGDIILAHNNNGIVKLGAISARNVTINNSTSLTLLGDITATGTAAAGGNAAVAGRIQLNTIGSAGHNITLGDNIRMISGNSTPGGATNTDVNIVLNMNGLGSDGVFSNGGFTLNTDNRNIQILANTFTLTATTTAARTAGATNYAIDAGTGKILNKSVGKKYVMNGDYTLNGANVFTLFDKSDAGVTLTSAQTALMNGTSLATFGDANSLEIVGGTLTLALGTNFSRAVPISFKASGNIYINGDTTTLNGNTTIESTGGAISAPNELNVGTNILTMNAAGDITFNNKLTAGTVTATSTNGNVRLIGMNEITNLGAISAKNVSINNGIAMNLTGNISANGVVGTAGKITIVTTVAPNLNLTLTSNVTLTSGNSVAGNNDVNIRLINGTSAVGGSFINNGKSLSTGGSNIEIRTYSFNLTGPSVADANFKAINAGTGMIATFTQGRTMTLQGATLTESSIGDIFYSGIDGQAVGAALPADKATLISHVVNNNITTTNTLLVSGALAIDGQTLTARGAGLIIKANGNISFNGAVTFNDDVTLQSLGGITVNQAVTATGKTLTLLANNDITQTAIITAGTLAATLDGGGGDVEYRREYGDEFGCGDGGHEFCL